MNFRADKITFKFLAKQGFGTEQPRSISLMKSEINTGALMIKSKLFVLPL
jgi:hypothetical protein